jgi:hypothetical protein
MDHQHAWQLALLSLNQNVCTATIMQFSKLLMNMFATCMVLHQLDSEIIRPGDQNSCTSIYLYSSKPVPFSYLGRNSSQVKFELHFHV